MVWLVSLLSLSVRSPEQGLRFRLKNDDEVELMTYYSSIVANSQTHLTQSAMALVNRFLDYFSKVETNDGNKMENTSLKVKDGTT